MQAADTKSVGIIGAGRIGQAMAQTALRAGRQVVIANSRELGSLTSVVEALVAPARVVKAANTLVAAVLGSDPHQAGGQRVIFLSGVLATFIARREAIQQVADLGRILGPALLARGVKDSGWGRTGPDSIADFSDLTWINARSGPRGREPWITWIRRRRLTWFVERFARARSDRKD
jgi:NAD(P)-dependent dehydrogenase (short-subunit alcohol dehydrogenase family)